MNKELNLDILNDIIEENNVVDSINDIKTTSDTSAKPVDEDEDEGKQENNVIETIESANQDSENTNNEVYSALAELMKTKGFIDYNDNDLESVQNYEDFIAEKMAEKYNNEVQTAIQSAKEDLDDKVKHIVSLYENGYDLNTVTLYEKNIDYYKNLESKRNLTESEAEQICRTYYKLQEMEDSDIEDEIEVLKIDEKLETRAANFVSKLKKNEEKAYAQYKQKTEIENKNIEENYKNILKQTKQYFESQENIFGIPLNKKEKEELFYYYANQNKSGLTSLQEYREKDPLKFDMTVSYLAKNNFDLDKLKKQIKSDAIKEIQKNIVVKSDSKITKLDINKIKKVLNKT